MGGHDSSCHGNGQPGVQKSRPSEHAPFVASFAASWMPGVNTPCCVRICSFEKMRMHSTPPFRTQPSHSSIKCVLLRNCNQPQSTPCAVSARTQRLVGRVEGLPARLSLVDVAYRDSGSDVPTDREDTRCGVELGVGYSPRTCLCLEQCCADLFFCFLIQDTHRVT
jgi:hypothetical protein